MTPTQINNFQHFVQHTNHVYDEKTNVLFSTRRKKDANYKNLGQYSKANPFSIYRRLAQLD